MGDINDVCSVDSVEIHVYTLTLMYTYKKIDQKQTDSSSTF